MKTQFGTWWLRLLRGGVVLTPIEQRLLEVFRDNMPEKFRGPIDAQLDAINLAQRHVEWRGINFYRLKRGRVDRSGVPPLPCKDGEIKLLSLRIAVPGVSGSFHVMFWSVQRFFFGFGTGESLQPVKDAQTFTVEDITHSWRSNVAATSDAQAID
jgi:hypothetical protein